MKITMTKPVDVDAAIEGWRPTSDDVAECFGG